MACFNIKTFCELEGKIQFADEKEVIAWLSCRNTIFRTIVAKGYYNDVTYAEKPRISKYYRNFVFNFLSALKAFLYITKLCKIDKSEEIIFITGANVSNKNPNVDAFVEYNTASSAFVPLVISLGTNNLNARHNLYGLFVVSKMLSKIISRTFNFGLSSFIIQIDKTFENYKNGSFRRKIVQTYLFHKIFYFFIFSIFGHFRDTKRVIVEEGHYQNYLAINQYFNQLGVDVAEHQHGMIHFANEVYYFPNNQLKNYANFLPNELMTFGPFWHSFVNIPGNIRCIGAYKYFHSPGLFFDNQTDGLYSKNKVLVLGTGYGLEQNLEEFKKIKFANPHLKVVFRPHPMERDKVKSLVNEEDLSSSELEFDLDSSDYVVGDISTVLFESILYGCRPLLLNTKIAKTSGLTREFALIASDRVIDYNNLKIYDDRSKFFSKPKMVSK